MKQNIISILRCPKCGGPLSLEITKKFRDRIHAGKLNCKNCGAVFAIIDDLVCFKTPSSKDKNKKKIKKMEECFLKQELKGKWLKYYTKQEKLSLKDEWAWMIDNLNIKKSKIHLDWATGTGRFLRNILSKTKGQIVILDTDYPSCVGLSMFLKKLGKYSHVTIIFGDARNMPFLSDSIGSVSSWHGLDEPKINKSINESKRVLKKNGLFSTAGMFYENDSRSLKIAKKWKIEFVKKDKAYKYFKKIGFRNIKYKTFFKGKWLERKSFLPCPMDYYTTYGIAGRK